MEETCFWRHTEQDNSTEHIQCYFCAKTFITKSELMKHRKKEHPSIVKECFKHQEGKCGYQDEFCWFIHSMKEGQNEKNTKKSDNKMEIDGEEEISKSVFLSSPEKTKTSLRRRKINFRKNINKKYKRRGKRYKAKEYLKSFRLLGVNAAGLQSKLSTFKKVINSLQPALFFIEESKYKEEGKFQIENFSIFELTRESRDGGGGLAIGCIKELKPVLA